MELVHGGCCNRRLRSFTKYITGFEYFGCNNQLRPSKEVHTWPLDTESAWAGGLRLAELAAGLMWLRGGRWSPGRWQQAETGVPVAVSTWREEHLRSTGCQVG